MWLLPKIEAWSRLWAACGGQPVVATRHGQSGDRVRVLCCCTIESVASGRVGLAQ
jgi:hypothetical protein